MTEPMSAPRPEHAPMTQFPVVDDCLQVGGVPLTELARRVGRTPFYAYDRGAITRRVELLREHLPAEVHLHYAIKANPMPDVVRHLAGLTDGLDVASAGEMRVALAAGMNPAAISFAGPGKTDAELAEALAAGIVVNLESEREMERLAALGRNRGARTRVAVRVNPDFELKSSGMKMGGGPKQFGVDAERVPAMLGRIGQLGLDFQGFHIFSGSQNLRADAIKEAQQKTIELALKLAEHVPSPVRVLNIGGGFGIPYFPGERPLDIAAVGAGLAGLLDKMGQRLAQARIVIELGRYIIGEAGLYVCRVIDRKVSRGHVFLITDGGLHHHLAASGNFGQVIRKNYPVVVGNRVRGAAREVASVVGPLCTPLDLLADSMDLAQAEVGDLIAVYQSGAYGLTASPTAFLSHPAPAEILV
jgi:diaminopimelate decarboxylase